MTADRAFTDQATGLMHLQQQQYAVGLFGLAAQHVFFILSLLQRAYCKVGYR